MLIDWFTVGAQALNFLILVWLMKRFLYQPVLDAIAAREQKIAAELADAATTKSEAGRQRDEFQKKNQTFDEERAELLHQARAAAKAEQERLESEARAAADAARAAREKALLRDARQLHADLLRQTQEQVFDISRRVLGDLASVGLEQRVCEVFIERLHTVEGEALATLRVALAGTSEAQPALLRSAFELPKAQRVAVRKAVADVFGPDVVLKFETAPELVSGIELGAQGQKLGWSIAEYLVALPASLDELLAVAEPS